MIIELEKLFDEAKTKGNLTYLFTLVRLDGITRRPDPIRQLHVSVNNDLQSASKESLLTQIDFLSKDDELLRFLANFFNSILGRGYQVFPFGDLYRNQTGALLRPSMFVVAENLKKKVVDAGRTDIAAIIDGIYSDALHAVVEKDGRCDVEAIRIALTNSYASVRALLEKYRERLLRFRADAPLIKLPGFDVLEFLVTPEHGLYGFKIYFSTGSHAEFSRTEDRTNVCNLDFEANGVGFQIGNLNAQKNEWRIGGKRLYEIGLKGRYNKIGCWQPLSYPVDSSLLQKEACDASPDRRVQGILFYMMCTGYRGIEFVIRTSIDLPQESLQLGMIQLWKCELDEQNKNLFVYDGWYPLEAVTPEAISAGFSTIELGINLLAFAYSAQAAWRVKYDFLNQSGGYACPTKDDLALLGQVIQKFPFEKQDEASVLAVAIDWFNRGRTSSNRFTAFLCFYVAIELVAHEVADGESLFGMTVPNLTGEEKKRLRLDGIKALHDALYESDPIAFIERAYFDCVQSVSERTKFVIRHVFGEQHPYFEAMFKKGKEKYSLLELRGRLAHGRMHHSVREDMEIVEHRLPEIVSISREFLMRLALALRSTEQLPAWGGSHKIFISMTDPRATMVMTGSKSMLPQTDWKNSTRMVRLIHDF